MDFTRIQVMLDVLQIVLLSGIFGIGVRIRRQLVKNGGDGNK